MFGDDTEGRSKKEIEQRHRTTAKLIAPWLKRLRGLDSHLRASFRNEYYWFSHQPYKQYLLGVEGVAQGNKKSYYSQGVGAVQVARNYFERGKIKLGLRWSRRAEVAWIKYFKEVPRWYNSHCWYATAVGFQGKQAEMERALRRAAQISSRPLHYFEFEEVRDDVNKILKLRSR